MDSKGEHLDFLSRKGLFEVDCSHEIFNITELALLEKWGHWFMALTSGDLLPFTEAQKRFISVMKREAKPETIEEVAWFKYLGRKAVEKKYGDSLSVRYQTEEDTFYSREDKKKLNRITFATMCSNHGKSLSRK